ncbi:membrane protein [Geomonas limicola]|uniref:Membrane protein n=1 Tax=Geomonas limicola TaxID=2740186 RepID=A0A6V8NGT2_9BACT|nr:BamA/TamA family outer membrane protein [Geomonas limicola]GFO70853.1 membrane protein [Geomonas limicola]
MRTSIFFLILLLTAGLAGCTSYIPAANLPLVRGDQETVKVVTIPLPVIASSPNEGITYGGLTAFLLHNQKDEVTTLFAPQVNYNENFGVSGSLYGAFYPSPLRSIEVNLAKSGRINEDYEIKLRDQDLFDRKLELNAFIFGFRDGSARFFGFQSRSNSKNETNYTDQEIGFTFSAGYPVPVLPSIQIVFGERYKDVEISPGAVKKLPFLRDVPRFANIPGADGFTAHAQQLALVYSSVDNLVIPTTGIRVRASVEASLTAFGSSADYRHYEAEFKGYYPLMDARFITVGRVGYNQTLGGDVPFLERSILGGESTLRGYGRNRFIDNSYLLCNLEERIRLFRWEVFGVRADWELAPFIDLGSVMKSLDEAEPKSFEFNPGIGFRAVVSPNIIGRIDVGFGKEGPAVFVGLGYPF